MQHRAPTLTPLAAWLLAALLLAAQALGLAHRAEHAPRGRPAVLAAATLPAAALPDHGSDRHEPGGAECRLVDQHGLADALWAAPALLLPPPRGVQALAWPPAPQVSRRPAAAYLARAPPQA